MDVNELLDKAQITVFIGKNGSGKSTLLRNLDLRDDLETKYISPERGGSLKYNPRINESIARDQEWLAQSRRMNRSDQFREQSSAQFRNLETAILREIEKNQEKRQDLDYMFDATLDQINTLLPAIDMTRTDRGFGITTKEGELIDEDWISSGESELIALAIEALVFSRECAPNSILLLDEPDVHLHPDLQFRFASFLLNLVNEFNFKLVIATHSTAMFSGLADSESLQVAPITGKGQQDFCPFTPDEVSKNLIPLFGVHPLANHFNKRPLLLVEGEDDRRVIEQLVRSSEGRFRYQPAVVGDKQSMEKWERWLNQVLPSIYDNPVAYSLRDLDKGRIPGIENMGCVKRTRLNCYAIENLLLTSECFASHGKTEEEFKKALQSWVNSQPEHQSVAEIKILLERFEERRTIKVKSIRNILCALLGASKPWEVVIGQLLANSDLKRVDEEGSLYVFIGDQCVKKLFTLE